jgi:ABC-2 type transport system ATP-binding protein
MIITNLSKRYGKKQILRGINFALDKRCTALLGPNGAGKTTLIKCVANLINFSGDITTDSGLKKPSVGYLPQQFSFLSNLTVWESLIYLGHLNKVQMDALELEVASVMDLANLSEYTDIRVRALSGGTLRRLGIAQSLLGSPELLLLDEPTAGLDIEERAKLKSVLTKTRDTHPILISTHLVEDIIDLCERVLVLNRGSLIFDGSLEDLASLGHAEMLSRAISDPASMSKALKDCKSEAVIEAGYLALLRDCTD